MWHIPFAVLFLYPPNTQGVPQIRGRVQGGGGNKKPTPSFWKVTLKLWILHIEMASRELLTLGGAKIKIKVMVGEDTFGFTDF